MNAMRITIVQVMVLCILVGTSAGRPGATSCTTLGPGQQLSPLSSLQPQLHSPQIQLLDLQYSTKLQQLRVAHQIHLVQHFRFRLLVVFHLQYQFNKWWSKGYWWI